MGIEAIEIGGATYCMFAQQTPGWVVLQTSRACPLAWARTGKAVLGKTRCWCRMHLIT